jgi:hypothetical protein
MKEIQQLRKFDPETGQDLNIFPVTKSEAIQGVDDEPIVGSDNLVKSGGVADSINKLKNAGYLYAGIATPTTNPSTPEVPVFYIATTVGRYSNFNNIEVLKNETVILKWNSGTWEKSSFKLMTDFDSVYDAEGNNLTKTFEKLYAGIRGAISYKILDNVFESGLYTVSCDDDSDTDEYSIGVLEVFYDSMKHILYHVFNTNCSNPNESYIVHSDFELPKKWIRRFNLSSSIDIGIPIGSWGLWELIENLTPELLEKLNDIPMSGGGTKWEGE